MKKCNYLYKFFDSVSKYRIVQVAVNSPACSEKTIILQVLGPVSSDWENLTSSSVNELLISTRNYYLLKSSTCPSVNLECTFSGSWKPPSFPQLPAQSSAEASISLRHAGSRPGPSALWLRRCSQTTARTPGTAGNAYSSHRARAIQVMHSTRLCHL